MNAASPVREVVKAYAPPIRAAPFIWRDPSLIPPRATVYGRHFVRRFLSGTVAPGGVGKSSQAIVEAVAMATGRDLLGVAVKDPLRVWYWNGEDPFDELERRVAATLLHYRIRPEELGDRLFLNSGRDCEIVVASETREGAVICEPVMAALEATITANAIDVFILDPFVSCHEVSENDNNRIGRVMKALAGLADRTNAAGELVHHVRKNGVGNEITVEDGRGAKAFIDRVRSARTLNRMSAEEAGTMGVEEVDRKLMFRVDVGKSNLFPPAHSADWRKLVSQSLGNGQDGLPDDWVGVVTPWTAPNLFDGVTTSNVLTIQQAIQKGVYREDPRSPDWVGVVIAETMNWDPADKGIRLRVKSILRTWLKTGLVETYRQIDPASRREKTFIRVKDWIEP